MNTKLTFLIGAVSGAAIGFVASKRYFEKKYFKKYSRIADREISEMRLYYQNTCSELNLKKTDISPLEEGQPKTDITYVANEEDLRMCNEIIHSELYGVDQQMENDEMHDARPFLISADIYHQTDGYDKVSLVYYENNILADEDDEIVDINDTVTYDNINELPDFDEAVIYVRNGSTGIDYQVVRDERTFEEATGIFGFDQ